MEILTVLKANIRHKKGAFISISVLMMIIALSLTAILSIIDNSLESIEAAHEIANTGDVQIFISDAKYTKEQRELLETHSMVGRVEDNLAISTICGSVGENATKNSWCLMKLKENVKLFTEDFSGYEETVPTLKQGEIYVSEGLISSFGGKIGEKVSVETVGGKYEFTIRGIVLEPFTGSAVIGIKQLYVSDKDFEKMMKEAQGKELNGNYAAVHLLMVYKAEDCTLDSSSFCHELNQDTGILDHAIMSLTKDMSVHYTNLMPEIIVSILIVFLILLVVIVLIVTGHNLSTSIEMEYGNLGILKSQGFGKGKIRFLFFLQYFMAQVCGVILGMLLAIPMVRTMGNVFFPITGVISKHSISFGKTFGILVAILLLSAGFIFLVTAKIGKISPIRAIQGGREEIYFDSRIKAPISKKGLSASLALRQFTSCKRRYAAIIVVVSILVFFMMTINVLGTLLTSKTTMEAMGMTYSECDVQFKEKMRKEQVLLVEETIEEITSIEKKYYVSMHYFTFEGEKMAGQVYGNPEAVSVYEGRAPLYDNEIVITEILAKEFQLELGDEVCIGNNNQKQQYLISGIFQTMNDTGRCFAISLEGAKRIGKDDIYYAGYSLSEPEKRDEVAKALNEKYGEILTAEAYHGTNMEDTFQLIINVVKGLIYSISIVFALVVVVMVCSKAFLQERTDIGIYKAIGFTSKRLRLQFALRFFIVAILGSLLGTMFSVLFSGILLKSLLKGMGLTHITVSFTFLTIMIPVLLLCLCFFLFAYLASGKTRKVEVRELVTE